MKEGEIFALVGESGCGKSTTAMSIMRLVPKNCTITGGQIIFRGKDLVKLKEKEMSSVRGKEIGMIFQNPLDSLNPVYPVGIQVSEAVLLDRVPRDEAWKKVVEIFKDVKIPDPAERARSYPHELSGGMRQRVMIAMMLSRNPKLLIADEPTTALDVTIQAQILEIIKDLKDTFGTSILVITHDFGIVAELADRVGVMYAGKIVEIGSVLQIFEKPRHPYTQLLMEALPKITKKQGRLKTIPGSVPNLYELPAGCSFHPRCPKSMEICSKIAPRLKKAGEGHFFLCYRLRLTDPTENTIYFKGMDIFKAKGRELKDIRRRMSMVFQDPAASLNPRATILDSIKRPLEIYGYKKSEIKAIVEDTIEKVALGKELLNRYPHQLSGGQQQRASIARALVLKPEFMVLDEPTSALDVSVQAQILNILLEIQERYNLTYLFITHNLSVVRYVSDRIGVMYLGKIVEIAQVDEIYSSPLHPYTAGLLSSAPSLSPRGRSRKKLLLSGDPPSLINPPPGCRLYPRCPYAEKICREEIPELREVKTGHFVACHRAGELDFSGIVRW